MARRRYISTRISTDAAMRQLTDAEALFWTWMIPHAEDDATITADPDELAAMVVPNRRGWSVGRVASVVERFDELELLVVVDGVAFYDPQTFYAYQSNIPHDKRRLEQPSKKNAKVAKNAASPSPSPSPIEHMSGKPDDSRRVFDYWREAMNHPGAQFSPERRRKIEARLREGFSVAKLCEAVDGCASSKYHMGDNDSGTVYDSVGLIFRNAEKVEEFAGKLEKNDARGAKARAARIENALECLAGGMDTTDVRSGMVRDDEEWEEVERRRGQA